jgi:hypothetical protein
MLLLFAVLLGLWRCRALRCAHLLLLAVLLLLATLRLGGRRRLAGLARALLAGHCRRRARTMFLSPANRLQLLQAQGVLSGRLQDLGYVFRSRQGLVYRGRRRFGHLCRRVLRLLEQCHLLAHLHQRTLDQRRDLTRLHSRQPCQSALRLLHQTIHGLLRNGLTALCQLADLIRSLCGKSEKELRLDALPASQRHPRIFYHQLESIEPIARQAVRRNIRRAANPHDQHDRSQHSSQRLVGPSPL